MKKLLFTLFIITTLSFSSCSSDDNSLSGTTWAPIENLDEYINRHKELLTEYYNKFGHKELGNGVFEDDYPYFRIPYNIVIKFEGINTLIIYSIKTEDESYELNYVSSSKYIISNNTIKANIVLDGEVEINAKIEKNIMYWEWGDTHTYKLYKQ